jgi:cellobiose transport system permease protein
MMAATTATSRIRTRPRRHAQVGLTAGPIAYAVLIVATLISVLPLYWMMVIGSHTNAEMAATPPPFVPNGNLIDNIRAALQQAPMAKAVINSTIVSGAIALGTVLFCTLAGFAFAKLRFRGNKQLMALVIGTMMVPTQLGIVPLFILVARLQWVNQLQTVILPTLVTAFGVYFMRQYLVRALPTELLEAAWIDGASTLRIFLSIVLAVARPAMAVLGLLTFIMAWNDFFWPIVALTTENPTVQVALAGLGSGYVPEQSIIMAGTFVGTLPILVVFAILGRQIVGGIMHGALKG